MESSTGELLTPESATMHLAEAPAPAAPLGQALPPGCRLREYARSWRLLLGLYMLSCCFCWGLPPARADLLPAVVSETHQGAKGRNGDNSYGVYAVAENGSPGAAGLKVSSIDPSGVLSSTGPITATNAIGIYGESIGGQGGSGGDAYGLYGEGGNGGRGGDGGEVSITNRYSITTSGDQAIGIYGSSYAGNGGSGGDAIGAYAEGGNGGVGGDAGYVGIANMDDGRIVTEGAKAHGIFGQSIGGHGGQGGSGGGIWGGGGCGSGAGDGGQVWVLNRQTVTTKGENAHGIFAQSIGGYAGSGGSGSGLIGYGGDSHSGGDGFRVKVENNAGIITQGKDADAIHVQSVGGGGGSAGAGSGLVALGGDGGAGGYGGEVEVTNQGNLQATGAKAHGISAQSIGGGGGSASSTIGLVAIGGKSDRGGHAAGAGVFNDGNIQSTSSAILAQSVGGGGGDGSLAVGAVAIGGSGGGGGNAGSVGVRNTGALTTSENNASAILAQSIGGGGGNGGGAVAAGFWGSVALGGSAAQGGSGALTAILNNGGSIKTQGDNSHGLQAQSLGGGGGNGGFAVAGSIGDYVSTSVALGGSGGAGGKGDVAQVLNHTDIATAGANADGILAQSVGGGGGSGGFAVAGSLSAGLSVAVGLGGTGGNGGAGGWANVTSDTGKTITTAKDNSLGILAQSVGGGGGNGGFSVAAGVGGISASVGLGGKGGSGGNAGLVSVDIGSNITTTGANAHGLLAQSVGGGGGSGGFSVAGDIGVGTAAVSLGGTGGSGGSGGAVEAKTSGAVSTSGNNAMGVAAQSIGGGGGDGGFSVGGSFGGLAGASVSLGGSGGAGGSAGDVGLEVTNKITTQGKYSQGLLAQSVGGGGGSGGFSVAGSLGVGGPYPGVAVAVSLGGKGGQGNRAGNVTVNSRGAAVLTAGDSANAISAQSIGGGGGQGGFSGAVAISKSVSLSGSLGGSGGSGNDGGLVTLTNASAIDTKGADAKGILAQSIGGGGGDGGFSFTGSFTAPGKSLALGLSIGGNGGIGGNANTVDVSSFGPTITTVGNHAAGVQAQSVGGGGGDGNFSLSLAGGGYAFAFADVPVLNLGCKGGAGGKGGLVTLRNTSDISTQGEFSEGLLAQSIGGGGGAGSYRIIGELSLPGSKNFELKLGASGVAGSGGGDAQKVTVDDSLASGATQKTVATRGANSSGITAQSIGAGGGKGGLAFQVDINADEGFLPGYSLACGGDGGAGGAAGEVAVTSKSSITTQGENSNGILAQSLGGGGGDGGVAVAVTIKTKPAKTPLSSFSFAKGGKGGSGNKAGQVSVTSAGAQISTAGNAAAGIQAQSVGGGGGSGGGSVSIGFGYSGSESSGALALSFGGDGGNGGSAGAVGVTSASSIKTGSTKATQEFLAGNDSPGIIAQSVGGGGGSGGFSVAGMFNGTSGPANASLAFSMGGNGGYGNTAGAVNLTETGSTIQTLGDRSAGLLAQSVGGGGGSGGFSLAADINYGTKQKFDGALSWSIGGSGGSGANAGTVTLANSSRISTGWVDTAGVHGHDSPGILAQSIGLGGGQGGFSIDGSASLRQALAVSIGGHGGGAGSGQAVTISNTGTGLVTQGDRSPGLAGQSVGGGGGSAGFSISGALSTDSLAISLGGTGGSGGTGGAVKIDNSGAIQTHSQDSQGILAQSIGGGGGSGGFSVATLAGAKGVGFSLGGKGGGGDGSAVTVTDTGKLIETAGKRSAGIQAQSIGGGGGSGGAAVSGGAALMAPIFIGAQDGASGSGQAVTVQSSSSITTKDADSPAILAQSIGAGGGAGGVDVSDSNAPNTVTLGSQNQARGDGSAVQITTTGTSITTAGRRSAGLVAQSIGAGGGVGWAGAVTNSVSQAPQVILGANNSSGNGGLVSIDNASSISVTGLGSHGIVAQSIGGGGGMASNIGQKILNAVLGGSNNASGDGGEVRLTNRGDLNIAAAGACGLVAQSIGGGGGLVNHTSEVPPGYFTDTTETPQGDGTNRGSGNLVNVLNTGKISATGGCNIGIAAQSLGGGGGLNMSGGSAGPSGGSGSAGPITIVHTGAINMTGQGSVGILALSETAQGVGGNVSIDVKGPIAVQGDYTTGIRAFSTGSTGSGIVSVNIDQGASLTVGAPGGNNAVALYLGDADNRIVNRGKIESSGSALKTTDRGHFTCDNWGTVDSRDLVLNNNSTFNHLGGEVKTGILEVIKQGGLFKQSAGVTTVAGNLTINTETNNPMGTYELIDGTLSAGNILIANEPTGGYGQLVQSGGTNNVGNKVYLGCNGSRGYNEGYYYLNGGTLNSQDKVVVENGGHFIQKGGALSCNFLEVQPGGEFMGSGFMSGTVNNAGSFHVTSSTQAGFPTGGLNLTGSFSNDVGGTLITDIASGTEYGRLAVSGLPGSVELSPDSPDILEPRLLPGTFRPKGNQVFSGIITCDGTLTGKFDQIINHPTLSWEAVYNPTSVDLVVHRDYTNPSLGLSSNQQSVGNALNRVTDVTSGDLAVVLNTIDYLSDNASVRNAYQQISPEKVAALPTLAFAGAGFQMRQQAQRLTDLRFGDRAAGFAAGGLGALSLNYSRLDGLMLAYNSGSLAGLLTQKPTAAEKPWGLYLYPSLILGAQQSSGNQTGYNFTAGGFTTGADYRVRDDLVVGLATGYSHTGAGFYGSGGNVNTNTWPLTAYAAYLGRSWYAYGSLGYALNLFDVDRGIDFGGLNRTASGSTTGHQLNAYAEAGYDLKARRLVVTPVASLAYSGLWVNGYQESGAGALNLGVASQQATSLQTGVGAKVAAPFKWGSVTVVPQAYATYQHEFANGSRGLNASLSQGGSTFAFQTDTPNRDFALVGAKADIITHKNCQISVNYNTEVGRGNYTAHSVYAGLRWNF